MVVDVVTFFFLFRCQQTGLGPGKVFVDLGSGVGNCVVQAALSYVF